jgi:hypothetical protein
MAMAANSEERIAALGKRLKGKIQTDWVLVDEAYQEPFDELMGLLSHRESVVACMIRQTAARKTDREREGRPAG